MTILNDLETRIQYLTRRYCKNIDEQEDYAQEARLLVWSLFESKGEMPIAYFSKSIEYLFRSKTVFANAKKRKIPKGSVSLDQAITFDESGTIGDLVGKYDNFTTSEELLESFIEIIKRNYSYYYVTEIKKEGKPRLIVQKLIRTLIEDVEKIPISDIPNKVDYDFFKTRKLGNLLWTFYNNSAFEAVNDAYKGEFLPWQFKRVPNNFWQGKKGQKKVKLALEWFCNAMQIKSVDDAKSVTENDFKSQGLGGLLSNVFNSSPFLAMNYLFSDLKPWEHNTCPHGFYDHIDNHILAAHAYIISKTGVLLTGLNTEETYDLGLRTFVSKKSMADFGLRGLLNKYENSTYRLFNELFVDNMLPWTLGGSKEAWKDNPKEVAAKAVRWLFEKYLKIPILEIPKYATNKLFWTVGFSGILTNRSIGFNSSNFKAVDNAYPGLFSLDDFNRKRDIYYIDTKDLRRKS